MTGEWIFNPLVPVFPCTNRCTEFSEEGKGSGVVARGFGGGKAFQKDI